MRFTRLFRLPLVIGIVAFCCLPAIAETVQARLKPADRRVPAPAFRLIDANGRPESLADYRGKVVLLNFWATECGGCRLELPWLVDVQNSFKNKNVSLVGISMDISYEDLKNAAEAWTKVKPFLASQKLTYPILMGDDTVTHSYSITALPVTCLIDSRGRIAAEYVGLIDKQNVEANINALLQEPR